MKAILVIDYASEEDIGEKTSIHLINKKNKWYEEVVIKPMPEKLYVEASGIEDAMSSEIDMDKFILKIKLDADKLFALGWNACLEEIERD